MKTIGLVKSLCLFAIMSLSLTGSAQEEKDIPQSKKDKIEQIKIAFITTELDLTTAEAEKFWPVYNELEDKLKAERKTQRETAKELQDGIETLSDSDIQKKTDALFDSEIKITEIRKEYNGKIADVIGSKKAAKLLSLEKRFKRELLNKLNERPNPPGPPQGQRGPRGPKGGPRSMN